MSLISQMMRRFFWQPRNGVPSLDSLEASDGVTAKHDVTSAVGGPGQKHPLTVVELADGKIVGDLRLAVTREDVVIGGLQTIVGCPDPKNHYALRRRRFRVPQYRRGTALLLGTASSDNYYHWLLESVPRWKMLQAANCHDYDFVLLHSRPLAFQDEVLDRLKAPKAKRLRCPKNFVHQFEKLVVPAMPFPPEEASAWACAFVRSLFPMGTSGLEKVYLRRGAGRRRLINESELETALQSHGFVSIQPDQLTVAEQAKSLSSARCVVAPHGAPLTNLLFAPRGALLVELFHPQHKNRCYINLAAACGHRYASLDGHPANRAGDKRLEYTVDVPAVLKALAENG